MFPFLLLDADTDSEEDDSLKDGWPPRSLLGRPSSARHPMPGMSSTPSKKKRPASKRACASPATLKAKQAAKDRKHKHFAMLLQEAGVSSSEDSFDQGY